MVAPKTLSARDRLKEQIEQYRKQYQEQQRLSPDELNRLANHIIDAQAKSIEQLEARIASLEEAENDKQTGGNPGCKA